MYRWKPVCGNIIGKLSKNSSEWKINACNLFLNMVVYFLLLSIQSWTFSSVGQSNRLITDRSRVRVPEGPFFKSIWPSGSVG